MSPSNRDPFQLERFIQAQETVYQQALKELKNGKKKSHWIWYIFPQLEGLGHSATSKHYGIKSLEEAKEYLRHPVLGPRLLECCEAILAVKGRTAEDIFDFPDDMKLRSSMTLFASISPPDNMFLRVLQKYFDGGQDPKTIEILEGWKKKQADKA